MAAQRRGTCVVFNHENFDRPSLSRREGSHHDVKAIRDTFSKLGFEVDTQNDLTREQLMDHVETICQNIASEDSCFVCFILTHGAEKDLLWARDEAYSLDEVI